MAHPIAAYLLQVGDGQRAIASCFMFIYLYLSIGCTRSNAVLFLPSIPFHFHRYQAGPGSARVAGSDFLETLETKNVTDADGRGAGRAKLKPAPWGVPATCKGMVSRLSRLCPYADP
jgi:hypothetical protein